jgi:hypothetical protein
MRKVLVGLVVAAGLGLAAQAAVAQTAAARPFMFGGEANYGTSSGSKLGVGARVVYPALGQMLKVDGLEAFASFDLFFPSSPLKYWEINANATYAVPGVGSATFKPYVGAGLNYAHSSVDIPIFGSVSASSTGLNLLGGARFPMGKMNLFAEAKVELHSGSQFVITGGVLF